jgi:hypothetical protein
MFRQHLEDRLRNDNEDGRGARYSSAFEADTADLGGRSPSYAEAAVRRQEQQQQQQHYVRR